MICFINRSTVDYDIRMNKYVQACKATNTPYFVLGWDRMLNAKFVDEHEKQLKIYSPYGQGRNFWHLLRWMFFVWFNLISNIFFISSEAGEAVTDRVFIISVRPKD